MSRVLGRALGFVVAAGIGVGAPAIAHAGGFEIPDTGARAVGRGGANVVGVSDPTALYYNPGALAKQRGTSILYNHNLVFHDTRFTRAPLTQNVWGMSSVPPGTEFPVEFAEVRDRKKLYPLGVFLAVASDFGLENWTFAAGLSGPSAVGTHDFPEYGPQSFMVTDIDVLVTYYSLAAAWKLRDVFGIGATVSYVDMISMKYALVTDATASLGANTLTPIPTTDTTQISTGLELKDRTSATATIGLWYRPHRRVELAASSRVVPIFLRPKGGIVDDQDTLDTSQVRVAMPMTLPAIVRAGVRYIHDTGDREWFDLELHAQWENWSVVDGFNLEFVGRINGLPVGRECDDGPAMVGDEPRGCLSIPKRWKDTVSVRLGGDVNVLPPYLTVRAGGFYESPAMRDNYTHIDFPSFHRGGIGGGITGGYRGVYLTLGYMHIFQERREVSEAAGKVYQERPLRPCPENCDGVSGVPANAGTFTSRYDILALGLDIRFRELIGDRRAKRRKRGEPTPGEAEPAPEPRGSEDAIAPDATQTQPSGIDDDAAAPDDDAADDEGSADDDDSGVDAVPPGEPSTVARVDRSGERGG